MRRRRWASSERADSTR